MAIFAGGAGPLEQKTTLVLDPQGLIVEQYSAEPLHRALGETLGDPVQETRMRDLTRALVAAADDARISQVLLVTHGIAGIGPASTVPTGGGAARLPKSGKKLYAYADGYEQREQYLLAAQADEVLLHPHARRCWKASAAIAPTSRTPSTSSVFERLLFRVGEYKSAGEPYIRADSSPESDEADLHWMNDVWSRHLADIADARKLDVATLTTQIDDYVAQLHAAGGDVKLALAQGLVDVLVTRDELEARLAASGAVGEDEHGFPRASVSSTTCSASTRCRRCQGGRPSRSWSPRAKSSMASANPAPSVAKAPAPCRARARGARGRGHQGRGAARRFSRW